MARNKPVSVRVEGLPSQLGHERTKPVVGCWARYAPDLFLQDHTWIIWLWVKTPEARLTLEMNRFLYKTCQPTVDWRGKV